MPSGKKRNRCRNVLDLVEKGYEMQPQEAGDGDQPRHLAMLSFAPGWGP